MAGARWKDLTAARNEREIVVLRALTGRPAEAERWLALADGATSKIPLSDGSTTIEPWVANLRAFMMPEGVERALVDAFHSKYPSLARLWGGRAMPPNRVMFKIVPDRIKSWGLA